MSRVAAPSGLQFRLQLGGSTAVVTEVGAANRVLDTAFADLRPGEDGGTAITLRSPGGREVSLWMDAAYRYVELSTGDSPPEVHRRRRGLGVEPMTAAPNAFRTGDGLCVLAPCESASAAWAIRPGSN